MNQGQEKFFNFILERVQDEKQEEAKALLTEGFDKQADGTFDQEYMQNYIPRMIALLKQECIEEVKGIMTQFDGNSH